MGPQTINFYVSGDEFPMASADLAGTFTIDPLPTGSFGVLTPNLPFLALTEIGTPVTSGNYALSNSGATDLTITATSYANSTGAFTDNIMGMTVIPGDSLFFAITYSPTAAGNDVDTLIINTDGGDFAIPLTGYGYGNGTALEGFETGLFPACQWTTIDADGDGFGWTGSFAGNGIAPLEGAFSATSASYDNPSGTALTPDNYLVTPQLTPDATNNFLSYFVAAQDANFPAEFYEVYVSTAGNSSGDFTTSLFSETLSSAVYEERFIDLSAYVGQNIYIAFRHYNVSDQFVMKIDAIRLPPQTTPNTALPPLDVTFVGTGINCPGDETGTLQVGLTGGGSSYAYIFPGVDTVLSGMPSVSVGGALAAGEYTLNVIDNCGNDILDTTTIAATSVEDDASFVYPWTTLCKMDSINIGPQITGLAGGTFSGTAGIVFESTATGKIDVLATPVGTYGVVYTTNGPCPSSDTVIITVDAMCTTTSVEDFASASLELYPNPNQG
ncbi:MAG: choice-of-anchor J domain-containing protein, partial [Bacteroidota bacterium]